MTLQFSKLSPAKIVVIIFCTALWVQVPPAIHGAQPKLIEYPPTYKNFPLKYAEVWNAVVRLVVQDMGYRPQVADPGFGFLSTRWKTTEGVGDQPTRRIKLHLNVKKAPEGTLVTVRCEIEEFVLIEGTDKGRWMKLPSDHSCEADLLDRLEAKLK